MASTGTLDIEVPRNGDYFAEWRMEDADGEAIDLTGHTLTMQARAVAGDVTVLATATIDLVEASDGRYSVLWHGSDFDDFGNIFQVSRASYDLKHTYPDAITMIPVRGHLLIMPEVTA